MAGRSGEAVVRSVGGVRGGRWDFVGRDDGETPRCIVMGLKEKRGDFSAARVAESDVCAARVRGMRCNGLSLTHVLFVVAVDADVGRRGGLKEYLDPAGGMKSGMNGLGDGSGGWCTEKSRGRCGDQRRPLDVRKVGMPTDEEVRHPGRGRERAWEGGARRWKKAEAREAEGRPRRARRATRDRRSHARRPPDGPGAPTDGGAAPWRAGRGDEVVTDLVTDCRAKRR